MHNVHAQSVFPGNLSLQVTWFIVLSVGCIVGGTVVLVVFGNHSTTEYTVEQLVALYAKCVGESVVTG